MVDSMAEAESSWKVLFAPYWACRRIA